MSTKHVYMIYDIKSFSKISSLENFKTGCNFKRKCWYCEHDCYTFIEICENCKTERSLKRNCKKNEF